MKNKDFTTQKQIHLQNNPIRVIKFARSRAKK